MSLAPAAVVTLGELRYDAHVAAIRVDLRALPGLNVCAVSLPGDVRLDAAPGDDATVELDGGDGKETVLTGTVRSINGGLRIVRAVAADASADLAALRPAATFEGQDAQAVMRKLASDAGADLGNLDVDLQLAAYVADQSRTAGEHVAALAELAGAVATIDADGALGASKPAPVAQVALRHGRELIACEVQERQTTGGSPVPIGFGPAGSVQAPGALRQTSDPLPADAPDAGPDAVRRSTAILRTPSVASSAGQAASDLQRADSHRLRARAFLLPALRPGAVVDVQDLPARMHGGPWLVTAVSHQLIPRRGGLTSFEARAAGGGAGGLLGAALGAAGGLL